MIARARLDKITQALPPLAPSWTVEELAEAGIAYQALLADKLPPRAPGTAQASPEQVAAAAAKYFKLLKSCKTIEL